MLTPIRIRRMPNKILITKDILLWSYIFGPQSSIYKTPNIDELAVQGTIFNRHYTAAPSTAMSISSMFTGKYPYQLKRRLYEEVKQYSRNDTLFDDFIAKGYETFVVWPWEWTGLAWKYSKVFPRATKVIPLKNVSAKVEINNDKKLKASSTELSHVIEVITHKLLSIVKNHNNSFIWLHLPHVFKGATG